ncbi:MAG: radical SAM protein, partial [Candidatus Acidiferrales bacterium]
DLLVRISQHSSLMVNMTVTTMRTRLARMLEPRAPRPDLRMAAIKKLREAGIAVGVNAMPILPGLTDREEDLDALARAACDAGAQWFAGGVLFLMSSSLKHFLPFLDAKFPRLAKRYREWYGPGGSTPEAYRKEISERVKCLRKKYGLASRPEILSSKTAMSAQLGLALNLNANSNSATLEHAR